MTLNAVHNETDRMEKETIRTYFKLLDGQMKTKKFHLENTVCGPIFEKAWDVLKLSYHNSVF